MSDNALMVTILLLMAGSGVVGFVLGWLANPSDEHD